MSDPYREQGVALGLNQSNFAPTVNNSMCRRQLRLLRLWNYLRDSVSDCVDMVDCNSWKKVMLSQRFLGSLSLHNEFSRIISNCSVPEAFDMLHASALSCYDGMAGSWPLHTVDRRSVLSSAYLFPTAGSLNHGSSVVQKCKASWEIALQGEDARHSCPQVPQYRDLKEYFSVEAFAGGTMTVVQQEMVFLDWRDVAIDAVTVSQEDGTGFVIVLPVAWYLRSGPDWGDVNSLIDAVAGRTFLAFYDSHEGQRMRASGTELRPFIGHHKMQFVMQLVIELALKQSRSERSAVGILGTNEHESIELRIIRA